MTDALNADTNLLILKLEYQSPKPLLGFQQPPALAPTLQTHPPPYGEIATAPYDATRFRSYAEQYIISKFRSKL
jgi:hypothetical protein